MSVLTITANIAHQQWSLSLMGFVMYVASGRLPSIKRGYPERRIPPIVYILKGVVYYVMHYFADDNKYPRCSFFKYGPALIS